MNAEPAEPADPPAADPPPAAVPSLPVRLLRARLLRVGRWIERRNLVTVGGWGLFAGSTVFAATLAGPGSPAPPAARAPHGGKVAATAPAAGEAGEPQPHARPAVPVRTASLPHAVPLRRWPSPPEGYVPPAAADLPPRPAPPELNLHPDSPRAVDPPVAATDVWDDALADLPPAAADDLNALRERFGSVVPFAPSATPLPVGDAPPPPVRSDADFAGLRAAIAASRINLAGAFTPGFRRVEPTGTDGELRAILTPGPLIETGRPLDLALTGPGWFALDSEEDGEPPLLTRAGSFRVRDGFLISAADPSRRVRGEGGGAIAVDDDLFALRIDSFGQLFGTYPGEDDAREVRFNRVAIVAPADAAAVEPVGGALYRAAGPLFPIPDAPAKAGFVEGANVNAAAEIARADVAQSLLERLAEPAVDAETAGHVHTFGKLGLVR